MQAPLGLTPGVREITAILVRWPASRAIAAIAREAGHRTKIAVRSTVSGVNPKGACIGPMGQRVRTIMNELHDEKIDIID